MKTSLESMKTISEKKFKTVDFDTKNEFFYNNAYTIIKSNKDIKNFIKMTDEFEKFYYPSMV